MSLISPFLLIYCCLSLMNSSFQPIKQTKEGRQYYFMHKILMDIVNSHSDKISLKNQQVLFQMITLKY